MEEQTGEAVYLRMTRFGAIPKGGQSRNARTGRLEEAVSVYDATRLGPGRYAVQLPSDDLAGNLISFAKANRRVYEIEGAEVGRGSSGEPLVEVGSAQRVKPPVKLVPRGREEFIDYALANYRKLMNTLDATDLERTNSGPQQIVAIGRYSFGNSTTKKRKRKKRR